MKPTLDEVRRSIEVLERAGLLVDGTGNSVLTPTKRRKHVKITPAMIEQATSLRKKGKTWTQAAKLIGKQTTGGSLARAVAATVKA